MIAEISIQQAKIALLTITVVYICILTPLQLYYAYKILKLGKQNIPFFTKRHPPLVIFNVIMFNIYPTLIRSFIDYLRLNHHISHYHPFTIFCLNFTQIYAVLCSIRLFLLYYEYHHSVHALSMKWKSQMSTMTLCQMEPWTMRYKWMGDLLILSFIGSIFALILIVFVVGGCAAFPKYLSYIQMLGFIYFGVMLFMTFQIRSCRDELSIKNEYTINGIVLVCSLCLYLIASMIFTDTASNIRVIATNLSSGCMCYGFSTISTYWIVYTYYKRLQPNQNKTKIKHLSLEQILSTKDGFDLFADHLVKEFSIENLFFLVEVVQIKNQIVTNQLLDDQHIGFTVNIEPKLLNKLKRTGAEINNVDEFKNNLKYIMDQYIYYHSEFCINISANARNETQSKFNEMDEKHEKQSPIQLADNPSSPSISLIDSAENATDFHYLDNNIVSLDNRVNIPRKALWFEYIKIFDLAMDEIASLMERDSLFRFYQTKSYEILVKNITTHSN